MQQFIDKLIGRLEREKNGQEHLLNNARDNINQKCIHKYALQCYEFVISIVNRLAEEYNGGWISVEDSLPELTEGTECFKQSKLCLVTEEWWDGDTSIAVGWYNQSGVWSNEATNCRVIAWMPLPLPYQKEGE